MSPVNRLRTAAAVTVAAVGIAAAVAALVVALTGAASDLGASVAWGLVGSLGFGGLGAVVASRRPRLPAGWLMLLVGVASGGVSLAAALAAVLLPADPGSQAGAVAYWVSTWLWVPAYVPAATLLLLVLPDGPLPGPWWRVVTGTAVLAPVRAPGAGAPPPFAAQAGPVPEAYGELTNPVGVPGAWAVVGISLLLVLVSAAFGVTSLVVRLRRSAGRERDQVLWVLAGALATILLLALGWAVPSAQTAFIAAALLPLPAAIAWALARTRLWDLDVALGRTLVYLSLSLLALAVYGVLLLVASTFLGQLTGRSDLLVFAIAAVLVQPARDVLQRGINRLLYTPEGFTLVGWGDTLHLESGALDETT